MGRKYNKFSATVQPQEKLKKAENDKSEQNCCKCFMQPCDHCKHCNALIHILSLGLSTGWAERRETHTSVRWILTTERDNTPPEHNQKRFCSFIFNILFTPASQLSSTRKSPFEKNHCSLQQNSITVTTDVMTTACATNWVQTEISQQLFDGYVKNFTSDIHVLLRTDSKNFENPLIFNVVQSSGLIPAEQMYFVFSAH